MNDWQISSSQKNLLDSLFSVIDSALNNWGEIIHWEELRENYGRTKTKN
jgi:hypothetical protein